MNNSEPELRGAMVCVDFADILSITLPRNIHHFKEILIVTTPEDVATKRLADAYASRIKLYTTRSFYKDGADFNKWLALEEGLDWYGRHGWICIMDVDVIWPQKVSWPKLEIGKLYGPKRYILEDAFAPIPPESEWENLPLHKNLVEWPGYTQIFHATDPHLPKPPWHEVNWRHAGGADSWFQNLWPRKHKVRLDWSVLHLGPCGVNWCGRAIPYSDGKLPEKFIARKNKLEEYLEKRRKLKHLRNRKYDHEKLK